MTWQPFELDEIFVRASFSDVREFSPRAFCATGPRPNLSAAHTQVTEKFHTLQPDPGCALVAAATAGSRAAAPVEGSRTLCIRASPSLAAADLELDEPAYFSSVWWALIAARTEQARE